MQLYSAKIHITTDPHVDYPGETQVRPNVTKSSFRKVCNYKQDFPSGLSQWMAERGLTHCPVTSSSAQRGQTGVTMIQPVVMVIH